MQELPNAARSSITAADMKAIAVETNARWSNPPYFGGYDQIAKVQSSVAPFGIVSKNNGPAPNPVETIQRFSVKHEFGGKKPSK